MISRTYVRTVFRLCLVCFLCVIFTPDSGWAQSVAVINYPVTVFLHPLMTCYRFEKGCFEKAPLFAAQKAYDEWLARTGNEIAALQKTYQGDLGTRQSKITSQENELLKAQDRLRETINALAVKFDTLRTSKNKEDMALLERRNYGAEMNAYEEKFKVESATIQASLEGARLELKDLQARIEAPRYTTPAETRQWFSRIENDILAAAQSVMKTKGCGVLLNSEGMGWPAAHASIAEFDAKALTTTSEREAELYKRFLADPVVLPAQEGANPEYVQKRNASAMAGMTAPLRRALEGRAGLRVVDSEMAPRILVGGISLTAEVVNSLLFQYKVPDAQRGLIIQTLREMNIP
ncbi:MAG: hypothetical protein WA705_10500 [Candidatus Ozemobacteraceae bacterium]